MVEGLLSSKRESRLKAGEIASQLKESGLGKIPQIAPLARFLDRVRNSDVSAMGLVLLNSSKGEPILNVYLLWRDPLDMNSPEQNMQMEAIEEAHYRFGHIVDKQITTFLEYVDPGSQEVTGFKNTIQEWALEMSEKPTILAYLRVA